MNDAWSIPGFTVQNENWGPLGSGAPTPSALPDSAKTVTVTGYFLNDGGKPASGRFIFDPSTAKVVDPVAGVTIRLRRTSVDLVNGRFSITLIASDNAGLSPKNFTYHVTGIVDGQTQKAFDVVLPAAAPTVTLASLVETESSVGTVSIPAVLSVNGDSGPNVVLNAAKVGADPAGSATAAQTAAAADAATKYLPLADPRLTDARTPTAHAASHASTGSDPVTLTPSQVTGLVSALSALLPLAGGTLTGGLVLDGGNLTVQRATHDGAYRLRVTGGGMDFEVGGMDVIVSVWSGANFTGTQTSVMRWEPAGAHMIGRTQFGTSPYDEVHSLDAGTGVAALGGKNGLANVRICGFKGTPGAPTTGAWAVGDVVLDSAGGWHLCTAAGTPGTWT